MKAHVMSAAWWNEQYDIPRGEKVVHRIASQEGGVVDYIITAEHYNDPERDATYKLYILAGIPMPHMPRKVKLVATAKDPRPLTGLAFGKEGLMGKKKG